MSATLKKLLLKFSWGRCWYEWVWPLPEISRLWSHFKQLQRKIRGVMRTTIFSAYWLKFWFSLFLLRRGAYHFNQISDGATALVFRLRSHKLSFGPVPDILISPNTNCRKIQQKVLVYYTLKVYVELQDQWHEWKYFFQVCRKNFFGVFLVQGA